MTNPKIVFLDDWEHSFQNTPAIVDLLRSLGIEMDVFSKPLRGPALHAALANAMGVVLTRDRTPFGAPELDSAPHLKFLIYTGARNGTLDEDACKARGVPVLNTSGGPSKASTTELTWSLILASMKRLESGFHVMRSPEADWRQGLHYPHLTEVLEGELLGLIGLGDIGTRVAKVAQAFGMKVAVWSPNMTAERAAAVGAEFLPLNDLLSQARVVSLHIVLSDSTRGLLNAAGLSLMRADSLLVNTSRAELIVQTDLIEALQKGHPAAAAIDVYESEPLAPDHPLRSLPQVTLTPHLGFVTNASFKGFTEGVATHLKTLLTEGGVKLP